MGSSPFFLFFSYLLPPSLTSFSLLSVHFFLFPLPATTLDGSNPFFDFVVRIPFTFLPFESLLPFPFFRALT